MKWRCGDCDKQVGRKEKVCPHCGMKFGFPDGFKVWEGYPRWAITGCKLLIVIGIVFLLGLIVLMEYTASQKGVEF